MQRSIINIDNYRYLVEYYNADTDMQDGQYLSEFVMLRNYNIMNELVHDNDIYIIEKSQLDEYIDHIKSTGELGISLVFPVTSTKINSYSNDYVKFNDNFNIANHESLFNEDGYSENVYDLLTISGNTVQPKQIKCDKIRIYHPTTKRNLNAIIDISNYINNVRFHYLCKPLNAYQTNSEAEIKFNNETYNEYIEMYFPSMSDLFGTDETGKYNVWYAEDFNIVASTRNEKFINSIMSDASDIEHYESNSSSQLVPFNLFIQPYRIVEEYAADSKFNYDNDLSNDEKIFVKLYLKNNMSINDNYLTNTLNIVMYPYSDIDSHTNLYILNSEYSQGYLSLNSTVKFSLMSRIGFSEGIISVVSLFNYPNKSYFYSLYKDDPHTSPIKEAYKYYNNIDDKYYNLFMNDDVIKELAEIDAVDSISPSIIKTVKEVANVNYEDNIELLNVWKSIMKETIIKEYEEEFGTPTQFLGFKIDIATDHNFNHIIYTKNVRVNFNDIDDFAFNLNNIFERWEQKPEQLLVRIVFYDRVLGIEIRSNIVIITKEWFKYLINNSKIYRLSILSDKNKYIDDMKVIDLNNASVVNFINSIKCIVHNDTSQPSVVGRQSVEQKIIFKPIFYKVKDLQNITLRQGMTQNIGVNLSEYMTKVETFKLVIDNVEYVETGRNDIFVIFNMNANDLNGLNGLYNVTDEAGNYISSGNWSII